VARTRRPASRGKKRAFVRKDWVYTEEGYLGTTFTLGAGLAAIPLTFSVNANRMIPFGPANAVPLTAVYAGKWSQPEGRGNVVYAVQGEVTYGVPGTWAAGNEFHICTRLVVADMNPENGDALLPVNYDLWTSTATTEFQTYRNQRDCLWERRIHRIFVAGGGSAGMWNQPVFWSSKMGRRLDEDQAVFLLMQLGPNSVASVNRNNNYLRTLMRAP